MFDFLPSPPALMSYEMQKLAARVGREDSLLSRFPPPLQVPLKTVDEVLACIESKQLAEVSRLEWIVTLQAKAEWDQQNPMRAHRSAELL